MPRPFHLLFASLLAASPAAVRAEPPSPESPDRANAEAQRRHKHGEDCYEKGDYAAALAEFEAVERLAHHPDISFNIGLALRKLHRNAEAIERFRAFLAAETGESRRQRPFVERTLAEIELLVTRVEVRSTPDGAEVLVDGRVAGRTPGRLLLDPGKHMLEVALDGYRAARKPVTAIAGSPIDLDFPLVEIPKIGRVRITSSAPKSQVQVDGKARGEAPVGLELGIGGHTLVLTAPGHLRYQTQLPIAGGEEDREVPVILEPLRLESKPVYKQWWPWTIGTVVVGGVAAGVLVDRFWRDGCQDPGNLGTGCFKVN